MSFTINAGTLAVGALLFILGVFIKPLVMVLRDKMVWWWIEKYLVNQQLFDDIRSLRHEARHNSNRITMGWEFKHAGDSYILNLDNEIVLNKDEFDKLIFVCDEKVDWCDRKELEFTKKSSLYDSLIKHYSQDKQNPIEEALDRVKTEHFQHASEAHLMALKFIIKEVHPHLCDFNDDIPF